jgi:hypothetical protein
METAPAAAASAEATSIGLARDAQDEYARNECYPDTAQ